MIIKFRILYSATVLFLVLACADHNEPNHLALLETSRVTNITSDGAQLEGYVQPVGDTRIGEAGFEVKVYYKDAFLIKASDIKQGHFSLFLTSSLRNGFSYSVRAYAKTAHSFIIYGNPISFTSKGSKAPIINDFTPKQGKANDVIIIQGDNFGVTPLENIVTFSKSIVLAGTTAVVLEASKTQLKVKCPDRDGTGNFFIYLEVGDHTVMAGESFTKVQ
jgi:hypothetical protein